MGTTENEDITRELADAREAPTITINGQTATLLRPTGTQVAAFQQDLDEVGASHPRMLGAAAAALAVLWPPKRRFPIARPKPWRTREHIEDYGAPLYDALYAELVTDQESKLVLWTELIRAWKWAAFSAITEAEVQTAMGFSEPQEGADTEE